MIQKIALLITGCYADLYASMQALQVADRMDARIYVLQMTEGRHSWECLCPHTKNICHS